MFTAAPSSLYIGPAGWTTARPSRAAHRELHPLEALARRVNLVEIDKTRHGPLRPETASVWVRKVESQNDFLFVAPLWRRFTHDRDLDAAAVRAFREGLRPLQQADRLGMLILEFPWAYRFTQQNREFLLKLRQAFHPFPMAAEFRHESWQREEAITALIQFRLGLVNLDQPAYFGASRPTALLTNRVAVVRFHGRSNAEAHREFNANISPYLYRSEELAEWSPRIRQLAMDASRVLISFAEGPPAASLANALRLQDLLSERAVTAPRTAA